VSKDVKQTSKELKAFPDDVREPMGAAANTVSAHYDGSTLTLFQIPHHVVRIGEPSDPPIPIRDGAVALDSYEMTPGVVDLLERFVNICKARFAMAEILNGPPPPVSARSLE
jgi:hypothetical protein